MVRHTICQQILSMLHHTPTHITDLTASPSWENMFLWLLTPFKLSVSRDCTPEAEKLETFSDEENFTSSVTYRTLNSVQTASVSSEGVEGVTCDPCEDDDDDRLYPIPDLTFIEASNKEVKGVGSIQSHDMPKRPRPVSMPSRQLNAIARGNELSDNSIRHRTTAFLDSSTKGDRHISIAGGRVVEQTSKKNTKRGSITYSRSWSNLSEVEEEEIRRTFNIVTETLAHLLWNSVDYEKELPPWKVMSYCSTVLCDVIFHHWCCVMSYCIINVDVYCVANNYMFIMFLKYKICVNILVMSYYHVIDDVI